MTLTGTSFTSSCVAKVTGSFGYSGSTFLVSTTTTYVSPTQLTVSGYTSTGYPVLTYQVGIYDTATQQTSNVIPFWVYPPPIALSINPDNVAAGSGYFSLGISAYDAAPDSIVWTFNGTSTYLYGYRLSPSSVRFAIPASLLTTPGIASISASGFTAAYFYITGDLKITSISPNTASAGDAGFVLTVNGAGFASDATVQWNGTALQTMFVSDTQLQALVPASLINHTGYVQVGVGIAYPALFNVNTLHVSGKVNLEGETQLAQNVTLEFRSAYSGNTLTLPTLLANDGSFDIRGIAPNTYNSLAVKGYKWLRSAAPLTAGTTPVSNAQIALLAGDANGDNRVDIADFGLLVNAYGGQRGGAGGSDDIRADFNG